MPTAKYGNVEIRPVVEFAGEADPRRGGSRLGVRQRGKPGPGTVWNAGFSPQGTITEAGFTGDADELLKQVADSTQGFTLVLAGLKALLDHDVRLNLVADRFPKGIEEH